MVWRSGLAKLQLLDMRGTGGGGSTGHIPPELGQLRELRILRLSHKALAGVIPPEIGNASSLRSLDLTNNGLTGTIPGALGRLTRLEVLYLGLNHLSGALPPSLGDLASLEFSTSSATSCLGRSPEVSCGSIS